MKPSPRSPFRILRAKLGLTIRQVATELEVTEHYISLAEFMVHGTPSPALLGFYAESPEHRSQIVKNYYYEQLMQRYNYGVVHFMWDLKFNTLTELRDSLGMSKIGFCKTFCIPPNLLDRVERRSVKSLPDDIVAALRHAHCTEDQLQNLDKHL